MLNVKALVVLFDLGQCQHFIFLVAWQILKIRSRRHKLDRVGLPDNFTDVFCFKVLLTDIPRLVVEKAVRVSHPSDTAEENYCFFLWWTLVDSQGVPIGVEAQPALASHAKSPNVATRSPVCETFFIGT